MPNKPSAKKDLRKSLVRAKANTRIKTNVKSLYKKGLELAKESKKVEAEGTVQSFQQAVDKASKRRVISTNKARRMKSTLTKRVNAIA
ncbi:30S ribosomal protein S20 [Patescibacteria group bacterium]|nr:30S ribosomal protein S20 [Patescibacteria group bacterium]MBU1448685.1 30S ribosomal protein S20 [Patescibacteria group bacterium]MBU2613344.1 30S ribosomal protein S20 [Patescibacteria group bacterium]